MLIRLIADNFLSHDDFILAVVSFYSPNLQCSLLLNPTTAQSYNDNIVGSCSNLSPNP